MEITVDAIRLLFSTSFLCEKNYFRQTARTVTDCHNHGFAETGSPDFRKAVSKFIDYVCDGYFSRQNCAEI